MEFDHVLLRKARLAKGLSVGELAEKLEIADQTVYNWEHGDATPTAGNVFRLARVLRIPITRFKTSTMAASSGQFNPTVMIEARVRRGMSRADVAEALQVDLSSVSRWESGVTPRIGRIRQLAKILKVNISDLYKVEYHREHTI